MMKKTQTLPFGNARKDTVPLHMKLILLYIFQYQLSSHGVTFTKTQYKTIASHLDFGQLRKRNTQQCSFFIEQAYYG